MSGPTIPSGPDARCPHCGDQHPASYTHCPKSGRSLASGHALIGRVIAGRYRILGRLGEGGMGEVFIAEHLRIGRKVAIKRLHPELASDERSVQRFLREARAAAATGHDHIVEVLDLGYSDDRAPFLVMEYLRGVSLADLLREEQRLAPVRTAILMGQVLSALNAVHAGGIIHRDLKPDNVFVTRRPGLGEFVKVLDFGISKIKGDTSAEALSLTRTGVQMGTPFYMSPEQARGMREVDHRVDLYAVGVMLYECLTGRLPFASDNYHALLQLILRATPRPPSELAPGIEPAMDALVMRSIGKDPDLRFQTAAEFVSALAPWGVVPLPSSSAAPPMPEPAEPPSSPVMEVRADEEPRRRPSPRYYFAASDDWQPERARAGAIRAPVALSSTQKPRSPILDVAPAPRRESPVLELPRGERPLTPEPVRPTASVERAPERAAPERAEPSRPSVTIDRVPDRPTSRPEPIADAPVVATGGSSVRGSFFVALLNHLEEEGGGRWLEEILGRLSATVRERVSGVILPMAWLSLHTFDAVLRAAASDEPALRRLGRAVAERELVATHRLFIQTSTPAMALERLPQFIRLYFLRADARVELPTAGLAHVDIDLGASEPVVVMEFVAGLTARLLELCGATDVEVKVESCRGLGDARTRLGCRFAPR